MAEERKNPFVDEAATTDADRAALAALILELRRLGIRDTRVLAAIETLPRRLFLPSAHRALAYRNVALPIECGQTISEPAVVAVMTEALAVEPHHKVLDVGAGSGYQTAVLARLARQVIGIERYRTLALLARERLEALGIANAGVKVADGRFGAPEDAPFDRILVAAATAEIPAALVEQLSTEGILVAPVGPHSGIQTITRLRKGPDGIATETLHAVRFVPLVEGVAQQL